MPLPVTCSAMFGHAMAHDSKAVVAWFHDATPDELATVERAADDSPQGLALVRAVKAERGRRGAL